MELLKNTLTVLTELVLLVQEVRTAYVMKTKIEDAFEDNYRIYCTYILYIQIDRNIVSRQLTCTEFLVL